MRATLNIPDKLVLEVQRITGEKSKTKAIVRAMEEYLRKEQLEALLSLKGKVQIDYDWKKEEERELTAQKEREKAIEK
jgi:hypothetical protein